MRSKPFDTGNPETNIVLNLAAGVLIIWPLLWAAVTAGSNPPHRYMVYTSVLLGCFLFAASWRNEKIVPVVMFIFSLIASVIGYYIIGLMLFTQLAY